jgi:hypothetical protein
MKITLILEGNLEEFPHPIQEYVKSRVTNEKVQQGEEAGTAHLTEDELEELRRRISKDAWTILVEIARRPDGYHADELIEALKAKGMNLEHGPNSIAGRLSSIGRYMPRFPGKNPPTKRDDKTAYYSMDPQVAVAILNIENKEKR